MNDKFDLIIIGGGPSGLSLAHCCANIPNLKILIIERENDIGGCHRVRRVNRNGEEIFTEHGPRIYSRAYIMFRKLLTEMNVDFDDLFEPYKFNLTEIGQETIWTKLNWTELAKLSKEFINLMININHGKNITMKKFMETNGFTFQAKDMIDRLCRLTDGADSSKYTLNEFLQLANIQAFYRLYQPKSPNDRGFLKIWRQYLESRGVTIWTSTKVNSLITTNKKLVSGIITNGKIVYGDKIICAIPPQNLVSLLQRSNNNIKDSFGNINELNKYAEETKYIDYISVTFHWKEKIKFPKVYGFPRSNWGVLFVLLTDYMKFDETQSGTVMSIAISIADREGIKINKTANECNENELYVEIIEQLKEVFPEFPEPDLKIISPGNYKNSGNWESLDTAFIASAGFNYLDFKSNKFDNLYTVGTHTGNHEYKFTSLESAVSNGISLSHKLYPELERKYSLERSITIRDIIISLIFIIIIYIVIKKN
jgi:hypothetical protein